MRKSLAVMAVMAVVALVAISPAATSEDSMAKYQNFHSKSSNHALKGVYAGIAIRD